VLLRNNSGAGLYSSPQGVTSVRSPMAPGGEVGEDDPPGATDGCADPGASAGASSAGAGANEDALHFEVCVRVRLESVGILYVQRKERGGSRWDAYCGALRRACGEAIAYGQAVARVDAPRAPSAYPC
jgi:hypothetical protein